MAISLRRWRRRVGQAALQRKKRRPVLRLTVKTIDDVPGDAVMIWCWQDCVFNQKMTQPLLGMLTSDRR